MMNLKAGMFFDSMDKTGLYISTKNCNFSITNFENGNFSVADLINKEGFRRVIVHFLCNAFYNKIEQ